MNPIGTAVTDGLSNLLPPLLIALILLGVVGGAGWVLMHVVKRNPVAHAIEHAAAFVATFFVGPCQALQTSVRALDGYKAEALPKWAQWAASKSRRDPAADAPMEPAPWHGWELTNWLPAFAVLVVVLAAHLAFAGLGATRTLGLSLGQVPKEPVVFGLTLEAIAFALAMLLSAAAFVGTLLDLGEASPSAARPIGHASKRARFWIRTACWVGIALAVVGLVTFALYRAGVLALDPTESTPEADFLVTNLPFVFIPIFELTVFGAAALLWWSVPVALAAGRILLAMGLRWVLWTLGVVTHHAHRWTMAGGYMAVSFWDVICKPFTGIWNSQLAGRKLFGHELPRIAYCPLGSLRPACQGALFGAPAETPEVALPCYCTPRPPEPAETRTQTPLSAPTGAQAVGSQATELAASPAVTAGRPENPTGEAAIATGAVETNGHRRSKGRRLVWVRKLAGEQSQSAVVPARLGHRRLNGLAARRQVLSARSEHAGGQPQPVAGSRDGTGR